MARAFGFTLLGHAIYSVLGGMIALAVGPGGKLSELNALVPLMFIGVGQLLYMLPAFVRSSRRGHANFAKGIAIFAAVTFSLNAACFGLLAG